MTFKRKSAKIETAVGPWRGGRREIRGAHGAVLMGEEDGRPLLMGQQAVGAGTRGAETGDVSGGAG